MLGSNDRMFIGPHWSTLTNLTALVLRGKLRCYECIAFLPALQILDLHFLGGRWWETGDAEYPLQPIALNSLQGLTRLAIASTDYILQVGFPAF